MNKLLLLLESQYFYLFKCNKYLTAFNIFHILTWLNTLKPRYKKKTFCRHFGNDRKMKLIVNRT